MRTAGCPILLPGTLRCEKGKEDNRMGGERGGTKEKRGRVKKEEAGSIRIRTHFQ